jgi:hypothetical protein
LYCSDCPQMKIILLITIAPTIKVQILRSFASQKALLIPYLPKNSQKTISHIFYHSNMPKTAKAKIWPLRTLGVKQHTIEFGIVLKYFIFLQYIQCYNRRNYFFIKRKYHQLLTKFINHCK